MAAHLPAEVADAYRDALGLLRARLDDDYEGQAVIMTGLDMDKDGQAAKVLFIVTALAADLANADGHGREWLDAIQRARRL